MFPERSKTPASLSRLALPEVMRLATATDPSIIFILSSCNLHHQSRLLFENPSIEQQTVGDDMRLTQRKHAYVSMALGSYSGRRLKRAEFVMGDGSC